MEVSSKSMYAGARFDGQGSSGCCRWRSSPCNYDTGDEPSQNRRQLDMLHLLAQVTFLLLM